jgi:small subunit ribosomal protein S1
MKQCKAQPMARICQDKKRGDRVKGPIKSITDFGVSVGWQLASTAGAPV